MTRARILILLALTFLILLLGVGGATWWYLFGPNQVDSADLVPADTIVFASIPNAATIVTAYQTSQLKQLVDSPNSQPVSDSIVKAMTQKNIDVLNAFLPNLSGQSFFAVTHFDSSKPGQAGIIAAMKPKPGSGNFDAFVNKVKDTWPDTIKQGTTGTGSVEGVDYQWIKGPGGEDKLCVAQVNGWIVAAWGEATLQDWLQRFHKKSITPSLAKNPDYQKAISRIGKDPMTIVYIDYHSILTLLQEQMAKTNPAQSDYLLKKLGGLGALTIGSRFENGEIVDRYSFMIPQQAQIDAGMSSIPCPFETLKFTGSNTRLYWASSIDWQQYWKTLTDQANQPNIPNPFASGIVNGLQQFAQTVGVDLHHNIIDALGNEMSLQLEWNDGATYPEVGLFLKIAKPDDFKPTITAMIETARKMYAQTAVINELNSGGQTFAALKFIQSTPVTFTITETGPYFGIFTSQELAASSFTRSDAGTLNHNNADFIRQIGDKLNGASQIAFIDTPRLADKTYKTALPYVSLLSMFNKDLAAFLQGKNLPPDLTWLAPMGTWSYVMSSDAEGVQGYSVSGIGNQGIFLAITGGGAFTMAENMGMVPHMPSMTAPAQTPPPTVTPAVAPPATASDATTNATTAPTPPSTDSSTNATPATPLPAVPQTAPDATPSTNATPADAPKPQ
jgi:hypothetical protein